MFVLLFHKKYWPKCSNYNSGIQYKYTGSWVSSYTMAFFLHYVSAYSVEKVLKNVLCVCYNQDNDELPWPPWLEYNQWHILYIQINIHRGQMPSQSSFLFMQISSKVVSVFRSLVKLANQAGINSSYFIYSSHWDTNLPVVCMLMSCKGIPVK